MKILVLLTDLFDAIGGIQTFNRSLVKALDEIVTNNGWQMTLLALNDSPHCSNKQNNFDLKNTKYSAFKRNKLHFASSTLFHSFNANIIILGHINFAPLAILLKVFQRQAKSNLITYDVHSNYKLTMLQRFGFNLTNHILSISSSTKDKLISAYNLNHSGFEIFPCTLDPFYDKNPTIKLRKDLSLPSGKMILTVSRLNALHRFKNIDVVIKSMPLVLAEVSDAFYVIVGDGSDRKRLELEVKNIGLSNKIVFAGQISDDLLPSYYQACDLFVLPSLNEGFGIVFLEAMYHSKPCIGADAGGIPEVIDNGKTGLLVKPNDIQNLANSIIYILTNNKQAVEMGMLGKEKFKKEFSFERSKERLEKVLCL